MAKKKAADEVVESKELAPANLSMTKRQDAVSAITTLADMQAVFRQTAVEWADIEPSFDVLPKESFEDIPFVIAGFRMNESTKFAEKDEVNPDVLNPARFLSLLVANYDPESGEFTSPWVIINDGSTGIRNQLLRYVRNIDPDADITKERFNAVAAQVPPIVCKKGLRRSDYAKDLGDSVVEATTWYIA